MNTSLLSRVAIAAGALALSAFANAQSSDREPGWEVGLDIVYQDANKLDFKGGSTVALDDDLGMSFTFGYRFNPHMELQFALDWSDVDYQANIVRDNGSTARASGSMESFTPRANLQVNLLDRAFTPFAMAGVGYSYIDTNIPNGRPQTGCWWDPWYGYICTTYQSTKTMDEYTYQFGLGIRWDFSSSGSLRVAYERHYIDISNTTSDAYVDQGKLGFVFRY